MKEYFRYRCWDWILCILISIGLTVNVLSGFEIDDVSSRMPVLIGAIAGLTMVYFLAAINKVTSVIGIILGVLALAGLVFLSYNGFFAEDQENSTQIFFIVIVVVSLAVFLVCRSRVSILLLFLLGNIIQAGASFLQFPCQAWAYLLFLSATGVMMFYRVYVVSIMGSHTGKIRFKGFMLQNICVCLAALVLASGIFAGIVRPLDPPTQDLKLIQRLMSFEVLEKLGVSSVQTVINKNKESSQQPDEELFTDQMDQESQEQEDDGASQQSQLNGWDRQVGDTLESAAENIEKAKAISYEMTSRWYLLVILAAVIVFLIWFMKKMLRKKWLDQIDHLPRAEGIMNLYMFFLFGLSKAGYAKAGNLTLNEYQALNAEQLAKFDHEQVNFERLTRIYRKAYYGRSAVSEEEYADFRLYYAAFHKNVRKAVGNIKYAALYFKL